VKRKGVIITIYQKNQGKYGDGAHLAHEWQIADRTGRKKTEERKN